MDEEYIAIDDGPCINYSVRSPIKLKEPKPGWNDEEWAEHSRYLTKLAQPKKIPKDKTLHRGKKIKHSQLKRISLISAPHKRVPPRDPPAFGCSTFVDYLEVIKPQRERERRKKIREYKKRKDEIIRKRKEKFNPPKEPCRCLYEDEEEEGDQSIQTVQMGPDCHCAELRAQNEKTDKSEKKKRHKRKIDQNRINRLAYPTMRVEKYVATESSNILITSYVAPNALKYKISKRLEEISRPRSVALPYHLQKPICEPPPVRRAALRYEANERIRRLAKPIIRKIEKDREIPFVVDRRALRYRSTKRIKRLARPRIVIKLCQCKDKCPGDDLCPNLHKFYRLDL